MCLRLLHSTVNDKSTWAHKYTQSDPQTNRLFGLYMVQFTSNSLFSHDVITDTLLITSTTTTKK